MAQSLVEVPAMAHQCLSQTPHEGILHVAGNCQLGVASVATGKVCPPRP